MKTQIWLACDGNTQTAIEVFLYRFQVGAQVQGIAQSVVVVVDNDLKRVASFIVKVVLIIATFYRCLG